MKSLLFFIFLSGASLSASANNQNQLSSFTDDSLYTVEAKQYLNHTLNGIAKARKYEKANNLTSSEDITLAERLSKHADELLTSGNYTGAIQCSQKARTLVVSTLTTYSTQEIANKYATFPTEQTPFIEQTIAADSSTLNDWVNQLN